ncbi:carboxypeptidase-like regulatory domain-containing protein [Mucilaginibacter sp.]|uniref:carboxypeptidase-like regulatory domain-containing protein n=1 Tax=Mucilaginibacter sp. TaxID=1882438 RepID=UPI0025DA4ABC|nr:carboxypeptidase-like regulatory domain-containing protein [Mucilaginibacter sp.]
MDSQDIIFNCVGIGLIATGIIFILIRAGRNSSTTIDIHGKKIVTKEIGFLLIVSGLIFLYFGLHQHKGKFILSGTVTDKAGKGIENTMVRFVSDDEQDSTKSIVTTSDGDGKFTLYTSKEDISGRLFFSYKSFRKSKIASFSQSINNNGDISLDTLTIRHEKKKSLKILSNVSEPIAKDIEKELRQKLKNDSVGTLVIRFFYQKDNLVDHHDGNEEYLSRGQVFGKFNNETFLVSNQQLDQVSLMDKNSVEINLQNQVELIVSKNIKNICDKIIKQLK